MKRVLVTGASSGIGAATARALSAKGYQVILLARSGDRLTALATEIGDRAVVMRCDASDAAQVQQAADQIKTEIGLPDAIIHCAGAGQWKTLPDTTPAEAVEMMNAPYFSAFNVTHAFLPDMLARSSGVIIHVNSPACMMAWRSAVGYTAARAALRGFHEALHQDLAGTGVHSCHVIFGKVSSDYFDHNTGVEEKMPFLNFMVPTLSPERCATILCRLVDRPRTNSIYPLMMRFFCWWGRLFPAMTRWLLRM